MRNCPKPTEIINYFILFIVLFLLHGCAFIGAYSKKTCEKSIKNPTISMTDYGKVSEQPNNINAYTLKLFWGLPYKINTLDGNKEEWIYTPDRYDPSKIDTWRGSIIVLLLVPVPLMLPIGNEEIKILIEDGLVKNVQAQACQHSSCFIRFLLFSLVHVDSLGFGVVDREDKCSELISGIGSDDFIRESESLENESILICRKTGEPFQKKALTKTICRNCPEPLVTVDSFYNSNPSKQQVERLVERASYMVRMTRSSSCDSSRY